MQFQHAAHRGFSLLELMMVMGIMLLLAGISVPAVTSLTRGNELSNASRQVSNLLAVARSHAVAEHTLVRFAVVEDWESQPAANYRRIAIWKYQATDDTWVQGTKWESMPQGIAFDPHSEFYVGESAANHLLATDLVNVFTTKVAGKLVQMKYVEFSPTGGLSGPAIAGLDIWMTLIPDHSDGVSTPVPAEAKPPNWAKITVSKLTGRKKIYRP